MAEWNIYCNTEKTFVQTWGSPDAIPTICPNDPTHSINPQSGSIIRVSRIRISNGTITTCNATTFTPLVNFITQGKNILQYDNIYPVTIKIVASVDTGSYDFRLVLVEDKQILYESFNHVNTEPLIIDVPVIDLINAPDEESLIDIEFKTNGGTLTLRNISIYFAIPPT